MSKSISSASAIFDLGSFYHHHCEHIYFGILIQDVPFCQCIIHCVKRMTFPTVNQLVCPFFDILNTCIILVFEMEDFNELMSKSISSASAIFGSGSLWTHLFWHPYSRCSFLPMQNSLCEKNDISYGKSTAVSIFWHLKYLHNFGIWNRRF